MRAILNGMRVVTNESLTEPGEPYEVKRSLRERLFSRPWRPLRKMRKVFPQIPKREVLQLPDGTLVMHPALLKELEQELERRG